MAVMCVTTPACLCMCTRYEQNRDPQKHCSKALLCQLAYQHTIVKVKNQTKVSVGDGVVEDLLLVSWWLSGQYSCLRVITTLDQFMDLLHFVCMFYYVIMFMWITWKLCHIYKIYESYEDCSLNCNCMTVRVWVKSTIKMLQERNEWQKI